MIKDILNIRTVVQCSNWYKVYTLKNVMPILIKHAYINAKKDDIKIIKSPVGMPVEL